MYDISGVKCNGWLNHGTEDDRRQTLADIAPATVGRRRPCARHIDLYDRTHLISFDTLETFFTKNLAQ